ncbi:MAG: IS1182 family transposase [Thermodesulfobacteriota bacterium]
MSRHIESDHSKQFLLPESIDDYIGSDHPARFIYEVISHLDLRAFDSGRTATDEGRPRYGARLLLSMWSYAYFFGIDSSRKLEMASYNDLGLIWLTSQHHPDHSTLARFIAAHTEAIEQVFGQVVRIAKTSDLVGLVLQAVDGTKIKSASSGRTGYYLKRSEDLLAKLDSSIKERVEAIRSNDASESELGSLMLPKELANEITRREKIRSAIAEMKADKRNSYHPNEPEAQTMECGPERTFGYNAQAVADDKHGIIVAADVTTETNDVHQLVTMIEQAESTLGARTAEAIADKGYASSPVFGKLKEQGYEATVAMPDNFLPHPENPFDASRFTYDASGDTMICPTGMTDHPGPKLPFLKVRTQKGTKSRLYQCRVAATCPHRSECSDNKIGRVVSLNAHHEAIEKQREKYRSEAGRRALRKRSGLIEPVFARIKQHRAFRRWKLRGLKKVKAQWALVTTAENLRIMYKLKTGKRPMNLRLSII